MKRLTLSLFTLAVMAIAQPASAATIIFDVCNVGSLCNQLSLTTTLNGSSIDVDVTAPSGYGLFGDTNGNHAFGINVNGSGVTFSNISPQFAFGGFNDNISGYGMFEFLLDGPHTANSAFLPLEFTVSRIGGFTSDIDLFETNSVGYLAAAHLRNNQTGDGGFVAADGPIGNTAVPEPATMILLGTGLLAAFRAKRA